eukprot:GHRR01004311.1.p1 GENE.GHRR01004311.1~~GHRR01004311.1.p1  ORF type:complete len:567 (+),score=130.75 GHRR01004311.1:244-1944(+)
MRERRATYLNIQGCCLGRLSLQRFRLPRSTLGSAPDHPVRPAPTDCSPGYEHTCHLEAFECVSSKMQLCQWTAKSTCVDKSRTSLIGSTRPFPLSKSCFGAHGAALGCYKQHGAHAKMLNTNVSSLNSFPKRHVVPHAAAGSAGASSDSAHMGPVLTAVGVACMGAFAFGYHLGVVNGPLEVIAQELGIAGNKALAGLVVSSTLAGAALGSLTGGFFADALGRRKAFMLCAVPMLAGPLLSAAANDLNVMVAGRLLAGIAIGLSSALVPLYISEVSPTNVRGQLGSLNQLMICVGILAALLVNVALPVSDWRTMFNLATIPAGLLFLGMLGSPESPAYLASKGRKNEAMQVATKLWGTHGGAAQLGAAAAEKSTTKAESSEGSNLLAAKYRKGVIMGCLLFLFQQFSGINAIVYFSSSVFKQAGIASGALASAAVGATNVLGTLIATGLVEGAGRKQLLTASYTGMAATMALMAVGLGVPALAPYSGYIALGGTLAYILSFAIGAGPVTGLIVPEINKEAVRGKQHIESLSDTGKGGMLRPCIGMVRPAIILLQAVQRHPNLCQQC